jgi:2-dehydropantoate 2-reductase
MRSLSTRYGSYWWPRRKGQWPPAIFLSEDIVTRREYSSQAAKGKTCNPKEIDTVEALPTSLKVEKYMESEVLRTSLSTTSERVAQPFPRVDEEAFVGDLKEKDENAQGSAKLDSAISVGPLERGDRPPKADSEKKAISVSLSSRGGTPLKTLRGVAAETLTSDSEVQQTRSMIGSGQTGEQAAVLFPSGWLRDPKTTGNSAFSTPEPRRSDRGLNRTSSVTPSDSRPQGHIHTFPFAEIVPPRTADSSTTSMGGSKPRGTFQNSVDDADEIVEYSPLTVLNPELDAAFHEDTSHTSLDAPMTSFSDLRAEPGLELEEDLERDTALEQETELEMKLADRTIHILGMGAVGKYIAHSLASLPHAPPITLLMHRPLLIQQWHDEGAVIRLVKNGNIHVQSGFHVESSAPFQRVYSQQRFPGFGKNLEHSAEPPHSIIDTLIVTTDPNTTTSALSSIRHRLRSSSTIFLVQDGLGIVQKLNTAVFPDPDRRPTYVLGSISHKIVSTEHKFTIEEKSPGVISCAKLPFVSAKKLEREGPVTIRKDFSWSPQARNLVTTLARTPDFHTKTLGHKSFYVTQLEKLAVGAVIGPLTVAFDCSNDQLLYNYNISLSMKFLLKEISQIICSLPELATLPKIPVSFSAERLEWIVLSTIQKTGKNLSSMLQDVRAGKRTDIEFYNGYLNRRASELGIDCPRNHMLLHLVKGKAAIQSREENGYIPFEEE